MTEQDDLATLHGFSTGGTLQALMDIAPTILTMSTAMPASYSTQRTMPAPNALPAAGPPLPLAIRVLALPGLCCQRLEEHDQAVFCFGQAGLLRLDDPSRPI
ncbi:hypothetical protein O0544_01910 [Edwardsiella anguillarum]|nr:hypothetical protein [Edwardsiella anguillarum]